MSEITLLLLEHLSSLREDEAQNSGQAVFGQRLELGGGRWLRLGASSEQDGVVCLKAHDVTSAAPWERWKQTTKSKT